MLSDTCVLPVEYGYSAAALQIYWVAMKKKSGTFLIGTTLMFEIFWVITGCLRQRKFLNNNNHNNTLRRTNKCNSEEEVAMKLVHLICYTLWALKNLFS